MRQSRSSPTSGLARLACVCGAIALACACTKTQPQTPRLRWYVFDEPSGAFSDAAKGCSRSSSGRYTIELVALPADADQQREQLVRRLAARDPDIDVIGMDVIWTAEFAEAGWIVPWHGSAADEARRGRLRSALDTATHDGRLWAAPFTTNAQLLWYRADRVQTPPRTWAEMLKIAHELGEVGVIQAQGERYEGLTVFFVSLLASAGGEVLTEDHEVSLDPEATHRALSVMRRFASSPAADPALSTAREDDVRLAFEAGGSSFMLNYTYVWPSAKSNAPEIAANMRWARWPAVIEDRPSRVTLGGLNLAVGAYSRHRNFAMEAAACIASKANQRRAATMGGLPPTIAALYDDPSVRETFPFADLLRETLRDAVHRPQTPLYTDVSLAIAHTIHPLREIDPVEDTKRLRAAIVRALRSEGLL